MKMGLRIVSELNDIVTRGPPWDWQYCRTQSRCRGRRVGGHAQNHNDQAHDKAVIDTKLKCATTGLTVTTYLAIVSHNQGRQDPDTTNNAKGRET
jgi:hypothetical protein